MNLLFVRSLVRDPVLVKPQHIGSNYVEVIERQLRASYEGVCSRHGFIMPGSITVHKVLSGRVEAVSLNGDVRYDVAYFASVCNPPIGSVLDGRVINMNRFGVLVHSGVQSPDGTFLPVVETIVTRQPIGGLDSEVDLDALEVGETVHVQIAGKKFELNDDKISVIGRIVAAATDVAPSTDAIAASLSTSLGRFALSQGVAKVNGDNDGESGDDDDEEGDDDVAMMSDDDAVVEDGAEDDDDDDDDDEDDDAGDARQRRRLQAAKLKLVRLKKGAAAGDDAEDAVAGVEDDAEDEGSDAESGDADSADEDDDDLMDDESQADDEDADASGVDDENDDPRAK
jgi:DNA-directed RNA polymerase subunit E'/Rpb7